jgi:hypothetical protein
MYYEYTFENFPLEMYPLIPNVHFNSTIGNDFIKSIVLIAMEDLKDGNELFASYFNLVK